MLFLVKDKDPSGLFSVRNGTAVKALLQKKLTKNSEIIGFRVSQIDTVGMIIS